MAEFDLEKLYNDASRLYDALEELHGIDAVLDGIASRGLEDLYYPPHNYTGGGPFNTIITLGTTHPFDKTIRAVDVHQGSSGPPFSSPTPPTTSPHDFGWVDDAYADATSWRLSAQGGFGASIARLVRLDSSRIEQISFALCDTWAGLDKDIHEDWSGLTLQHSEWEGSAANAFFANFEVPMRDVMRSHKYVLDYLNSLVCAVKAGVDAAQVSLQNLVTQCRELADDQLLKRAEDNRGSGKEDVELLAAVTGVGAAITFPVPGLSAALGATSAMLGYAASQVPDELAETTTLEAASATEIDDVLSAEITELEDNRDSYLDSVDHEATNLDADIAVFQEVQAGKVADSWTPIRPDVDPGTGWQHGSAS